MMESLEPTLWIGVLNDVPRKHRPFDQGSELTDQAWRTNLRDAEWGRLQATVPVNSYGSMVMPFEHTHIFPSPLGTHWPHGHSNEPTVTSGRWVRPRSGVLSDTAKSCLLMNGTPVAHTPEANAHDSQQAQRKQVICTLSNRAADSKLRGKQLVVNKPVTGGALVYREEADHDYARYIALVTTLKQSSSQSDRVLG